MRKIKAHDNILDIVLDKIKKLIDTEKFDDTKNLIDTDDFQMILL